MLSARSSLLGGGQRRVATMLLAALTRRQRYSAFTAVFDGATDGKGLRYDGVTGGCLVAMTAAEALDDLAAEADVHEALAHLSDRLDDGNFLGEPRPLPGRWGSVQHRDAGHLSPPP